MNSTTHDSFNCNKFGDSSPFPSMRSKHRVYVGCKHCCEKDVSPIEKKCPLSCRPKEHMDWEYC